VPLQQPWIQQALQSGVRLTSELELAFAFLTNEHVICITGSVGKSTTTSLLGAGALALDPHSFVGGNLGTPLAEYSCGLIDGSQTRATWILLELSSYQLENFRNLRSEISLLTHLSPNHLERYRDLSHYYETKIQLFKNTTGTAILNRSGGQIALLLGQIQKSNSQIRWLWTDRNDPDFKGRIKEKPALVGTHNLDNLALAFAASKTLGWPTQAELAMLRFPGLPHRLENCGEQQGLLFLNDSKATSIDSVLQAVQSVRNEFPARRIVLLLGGRNKNLPWKDLSPLRSDPAMRFCFFGEVANEAQTSSKLPGSSYQKFSDCLRALKAQLKAGDIVLLSPGGTSLDEFKNFEERGLAFKNWMLSEFQNNNP
jgi:UDP-N-acetylmuramoylalanine--D-glutamate ligase